MPVPGIGFATVQQRWQDVVKAVEAQVDVGQLIMHSLQLIIMLLQVRTLLCQLRTLLCQLRTLLCQLRTLLFQRLTCVLVYWYGALAARFTV